LADGLTYFVTSASGFGGLVLCWDLWARIPDPTDIEVSTLSLLGFLAVYGILGVTGKLPDLINRGRLFPPYGSD
jgi:hypothetical protein